MARFIAGAERAVTIADSIPDKRFLHEARYTLAALKIARASRDLTVLLAGQKTLSPSNRREAARLFEQIHLALAQVAEELVAYSGHVSRFVRLYARPGVPPDRAGGVDRPPGGSEQEIAVDVHRGRAGATNLQHEYKLRLPQYDPQVRYTLLARVGISTSQADAQNRTSQGDIHWRQVKED